MLSADDIEQITEIISGFWEHKSQSMSDPRVDPLANDLGLLYAFVGVMMAVSDDRANYKEALEELSTRIPNNDRLNLLLEAIGTYEENIGDGPRREEALD